MALFGTKKKETEAKPVKAVKAAKASKTAAPKAVASKASVPAVAIQGMSGSSAHIIVRPRITEKPGVLSQMGVYTFEVAKDAKGRVNLKTVATPLKDHQDAYHAQCALK